MIKDDQLKEFSKCSPFKYSDIKKLNEEFNLNEKDLKSILYCCDRCDVDLESLSEVLRTFKK